MIKKILAWLPLVLVCLVSDSLFSSPLKSIDNGNNTTNLSSEERFFFGENSSDSSSYDLSTIPSNISSDPKVIDNFAQSFLSDLLSGNSDEIAEYIKQHPISVEDLPTPSDIDVHKQEALDYKEAFSVYLSALTYLQNKKDSMDEKKFKERFDKKLFQYKDNVASVTFVPVNGQAMVTIILKRDPNTAYNFYVYDPSKRVYELDNTDNEALEKDIKTMMGEVDIFTSKQHMEKLVTVTTRLAQNNKVSALERSDYPRFLKDPLRFLNEYAKSIKEKPQYLIGFFSTVMQVSILLAITYSQTPAGTDFSSFMSESALPMAVTATFAMLIGSYAGTYRNFIDHGHIVTRMLKDTSIGLLFSYSLTIAKNGFGSLDIFSLAGIANNLWVIAVTFITKYFKYPITYVLRKWNDFGYYGPDGKAEIKIGKLGLNIKTLHNQVVYNGINFVIKIAALLGFTVTINEAQYNIGNYLFIVVPVLAFLANGAWIKYEYKNMLKKYIQDPSEEHKVGLQRRSSAFKKYRKYIYTTKSFLFRTLGFVSGSWGLNYFKGKYHKDYAKAPEEFNKEEISKLTKHTISKLSISQLQDLISECFAIIDSSDGEIDESIIDALINAKLVYASKRKSSHMLNKVIEQSKTVSLPAAVNNSCSMLFTMFF